MKFDDKKSFMALNLLPMKELSGSILKGQSLTCKCEGTYLNDMKVLFVICFSKYTLYISR